MSLSIVIPARNEEGCIIQTLTDLKRKLRIKNYKIIVVNDHSTDQTLPKVKTYMRKHPNVNVVSTKKDRGGFSNALKMGFSKAKTEFIVVVMADLCDNPLTINKMYTEIQNGWDIVCGSRYMKRGKKIGGPKLQNFLSKMVCLSLYYLFGIPSSDVSNAFKMYRKKVIDKVIFNPTSGVEASMELTIQAYLNGAKITNVPTTWTGRKIGKSKFKLLSRAPKYGQIYWWTIQNILRIKMGLNPKKFYVVNG